MQLRKHLLSCSGMQGGKTELQPCATVTLRLQAFPDIIEIILVQFPVP